MTISSTLVKCDLGHSHWSKGADGYCDTCRSRAPAFTIDNKWAYVRYRYYEDSDTRHYCSTDCLLSAIGQGWPEGADVEISFTAGPLCARA